MLYEVITHLLETPIGGGVAPCIVAKLHGERAREADFAKPGEYLSPGDRTAGANPIRQELWNLNEAGTLYGPIIYQKAPIVMIV